MRLFIERPSGECVEVEGGFTEETAKAFLQANGHDCYLERQERPKNNVTLTASDPELGVEIASATETAFVAYTRPRSLADGDGRRTVEGYPGADVAERIRKKRHDAAIAAWNEQRSREEAEVLAEMAAERAALGQELTDDDREKARRFAEQERPLTAAEIAEQQRQMQEALAAQAGVMVPTLENLHAEIDAAEARDRAKAEQAKAST